MSTTATRPEAARNKLYATEAHMFPKAVSAPAAPAVRYSAQHHAPVTQSRDVLALAVAKVAQEHSLGASKEQ